MSALTHCPECGCELAPRDPAGLPLVAEHAPGCTAMADAAAEIAEELDPGGTNGPLRAWAEGFRP